MRQRLVSAKFKKNVTNSLKPYDKLVGILTKKGHKSRAVKFVQIILTQLKLLGKREPIGILNRIIQNLIPVFNLRVVKRGGRFFKIPIPISKNRAIFFAIFWLVKAAFLNTKNNLTVPEYIIIELRKARKRRGQAFAYLKEALATAIDNRPFMRYIRWRKPIFNHHKRAPDSIYLRKVYRYGIWFKSRHKRRMKKYQKVKSKRRVRKYTKLRFGKKKSRFQSKRKI